MKCIQNQNEFTVQNVHTAILYSFCIILCFIVLRFWCSNEEGLYYGVNLREDNFLLLSARLRGKHEPITDLQREEVDIPTEVISGSLKVHYHRISTILLCYR